ncbi:MAG: hypothetical protein P8L79_11590 [Rhodospirillaceae bacterium]|nr:hypothetical protein [Rhodospirillaceae bacterium]
MPYVSCLTVCELEGAFTRAEFKIIEAGVFGTPSLPSRFIVDQKA